MKIQLNNLIIFMVMLTLISSATHAKEYYKWVDENGVTHYGEDVPAENVEHEAFNFPEQYTTSDPKQDYYSIQNQLDRLVERRQQLQRQRDSRKNVQTASTVSPVPVFVEERGVFFSGSGFNRFNNPKPIYSNQEFNPQNNRARTRIGRQLENQRRGSFQRNNASPKRYVEPRATRNTGIVSRR